LHARRVVDILFLFCKQRRIDDFGDLILFFVSPQDFGAEGVDLYDDVISAPSASLEDNDENVQPAPTNNGSGPHNSPPMEKYQSSSSMRGDRDGGRRHQLYIGNLTWVCLP